MCIRDRAIVAFIAAAVMTLYPVSYTHLDVYKRQLMGIVCDRTNSKYGKFRPWILWTAVPLGITLSLLFTTPNLGPTGQVVYALSLIHI